MKKLPFLIQIAILAGCGADAPRPTNQDIIAYAAENCPWIQPCSGVIPNQTSCPTIAICPDLGPVFIGERPLLR